MTQHLSEAAFNSASSGWYNAGHNLILAKSGIMGINTDKTLQFNLQSTSSTASVHFVCDNSWTNLGDDIYVVGNCSELGNWDVNNGVKLDPNIYYEYIYNPPPNHNGPGPSTPKWTGFVRDLPTNTSVEWKCVKKLNSGGLEWEPAANNIVSTSNSGFSGTSIGSF